MLSYTLLTVAVKCFMLIFYIFYFDCDKFGSEGSFSFKMRGSKNIALKEFIRAEFCLTNKESRHPPPPQPLYLAFLRSAASDISTWKWQMDWLLAAGTDNSHLWQYLWSPSTQEPTLCDGREVAFDNLDLQSRHPRPGGIIAKCYLLKLGLCS